MLAVVTIEAAKVFCTQVGASHNLWCGDSLGFYS
jgi:hypothetical protein